MTTPALLTPLAPQLVGNQGGDGSAAPARRCLSADGLLDAPTAEAAYRLVFPYLPRRPDHRLPRRPGPDHPGR